MKLSNNSFAAALCVAVLGAATSISSMASDFSLVADLVPSNLRTTDWGQVHRLDGDNRLLAGWARFGGQPVQAPACGTVAVLERGANGQFAEVAQLSASDVDGSCKAGDMFGTSIHIHGDLLVIGAPAGVRQGTSATDADAGAYVFQRDNSLAAGWRGVARVRPASLPAGKGFGLHVRSDGQWLAVQQHRYDSVFGFRFQIAEAVHLFRRAGSDASNWEEVTRLQDSRPYFGYSFEFSGQDLLIGAPETVQSLQQGPGRVYVHRRDEGGSGQWGRVQTLSITGDNNFGFVMAADGNRLAVSSINIAARGSAHVFERDAGGNWARLQTLRPAQGQNNDVYGSGIALRGDTLVVAAQNGRDNQATQGRVHIYKRGDNGLFSETQTVVAPDATRNDQLGNHISLGDAVLVLASPGATVNGDRAALFHYEREFQGGFAVDAGISGLWYDPARDGEGFSVEIIDAESAMVIWYTYDNEGEQMWLWGMADIDAGSLQVDSLLRPLGARFGAGFDADDVDRQHWGSLRMDFADCDSGQFSYQGPDGFGSGSHPLVRLGQMSGLSCGADSEDSAANRLSGHFFDPARSGEGFSVQMLDVGGPQAIPVVYWFTYRPEGGQAWMIGIGELQGSSIVASDVLRPIGARFGNAFSPGDVERRLWGSWELDYSDCNQAVLGYDSVISGYGFVAQTLQRMTLPAGINCPAP